MTYRITSLIFIKYINLTLVSITSRILIASLVSKYRCINQLNNTHTSWWRLITHVSTSSHYYHVTCTIKIKSQKCHDSITLHIMIFSHLNNVTHNSNVTHLNIVTHHNSVILFVFSSTPTESSRTGRRRARSTSTGPRPGESN